jgi:hypothetical protein
MGEVYGHCVGIGRVTRIGHTCARCEIVQFTYATQFVSLCGHHIECPVTFSVTYIGPSFLAND